MTSRSVKSRCATVLVIALAAPVASKMKREIKTLRDAIIHTVGRVAIACCATMVLAMVLIIVVFGTDFERNVPLGSILTKGILIGVVIAAALTAALSFRSGLLMMELNRAKNELLEISRRDQLTGLLNRRGYTEMGGKIFNETKADNRQAVALMCDIDRFKAVNDQFGHEFGDKVLAEIGETIGAFFEDHDGALVARYGGEEFAALMVDVSPEQAIQTANALRRICATTTVSSHDGASANVTVSIGIASCAGVSDLPSVLRAADEALYLAKRSGRDRVVQAEIAAAA